MSELYNVYCDESCHLENDHQKVMVLGAVWCPISKCREIADRIRDIKQRHGLSAHHEVKWTNVSPAKLAFYLDLVDFFFDDDDLHFRALVVPDKSVLNHQHYQQEHDDWYYKMYFNSNYSVPRQLSFPCSAWERLSTAPAVRDARASRS